MLPALVFAQTGSGIGGPVSPSTQRFTFGDVIRILNTIVSWMFTIFLIIAVIFIIWAAFKYLTSGGDPEGVKDATKMVIYAAVAIAVALLSAALRFAVQDLLGIAPE